MKPWLMPVVALSLTLFGAWLLMLDWLSKGPLKDKLVDTGLFAVIAFFAGAILRDTQRQRYRRWQRELWRDHYRRKEEQYRRRGTR
jgi:hypothetical protein